MCLIQEGDEAAIHEIMYRYKHKLYAFIIHYVREEDVAYDMLQETFIRVYFKASTYNPSYRFSTWLYQIAINLCRDWARKKKIKQCFSLDASFGEDNNASFHDIIADPQTSAEEIADIRENLNIVDKAIQDLPHKLRTALILFAIEGHSQERCAELLGVTPKTIETRVYRARKILNQKMKKK